VALSPEGLPSLRERQRKPIMRQWKWCLSEQLA
jgi:hypothetical protein